jgi:zinc transporter 4/zinc transporter 10/zinc transporter 12
MVVFLSLLSLLGVFIVPLAKRFDRAYEYARLFLVALGTSALFSDAILHIIPEVS